MKSMTPSPMAAPPVTSAAQAHADAPQEPAAPALPKPTEMMVIETVRQGVTRQQVMAVLPAEVRATVKLYLDGKIRQWYSRGDGKGVIFLVEAKTEHEARALIETLPLAKEHLMDHQYVPVGPLMPLQMLMGPEAQQ